jgi:hypothetical protein
MKCRRCGSDMKDGWGYCPRCGARKGADEFDSFGRDLFSQMFSRMRSSFKDIDSIWDMSDKDVEALDLSPWFSQRGREGDKPRGPVKGKGFTVRITSGTGMKPKVDVRTFGGVDKARLEDRLKGSLVVRQGGVPVRQPAEPKDAEKPRRRFGLPSLARKGAPTCTEEPNAEVKRIGDSVNVDICLPGVKSEEDVEIKELESSIEVRAMAGDKAYFKILTKPSQFRLSKSSFGNGNLHLEFS